MAGFVPIEPAGIARDEEISGWLQMARE